MTPKYLKQNYLRQNAPKKDGTPGSYSLRFLLTLNPMHKPRRVEIGLGTCDRDEAYWRARTILKAIWVLGGEFTSRVRVTGRGGRQATIQDAIPERAHQRATKRDGNDDLPLFYPQPHWLADQSK